MTTKRHWNIASFQKSQSDYGLEFDQKECWENTENHFICLDKFNDVYGRHFLIQTTTRTARGHTNSGRRCAQT